MKRWGLKEKAENAILFIVQQKRENRKGNEKKTKLNKDPRIPHKFAPNILTKNYKLLQTMQQLHIYK